MLYLDWTIGHLKYNQQQFNVINKEHKLKQDFFLLIFASDEDSDFN